MANPTGGAVNLGSAYGEVLIDFSNVERQLNSAFGNAERSMSGFMNRTGASMQRIGTAVTIATLPVAGFMKKGIAAFANFEEVLAEIEARTGATADQMKIVEQVALDMGKKTAFSAKEAAEGMLQLLASGMDTNQAIAALGPTLDLAAAGHIQLGEAASVVTTILGQFNLEADQSGRVADALAKASAASMAEVSDLGQAFANVGPIANRFGLSVEDTAAILAEFANKGIMGAEAGTQLKSMLTNLSRPTKDVQDMWKKLGVSLYDARGNIRPLNTVLQELNRKLATMTEQERNEAVTTLAGSFGQMGLETLLASNGFDTMTASMEKQASAAKVAERWMTTLKGKMESMLGSLETVMIRIFKPLSENILKPLIDRGTEFLNWISDVLEKTPGLAYGLGLVLGVLVLMGPALVTIGTGLRIISMLMQVGSIGSIAAMLGPVLPILLAVAAAIGVVALAYKTNFLGFADFVNGFVGQIELVANTVQGFIDRVKEVGLSQALNEFYASGGRFQKMSKGVVKGILDIVGAVGGFIKLVKQNGLSEALQTVFAGPKIGDKGSWIGNILQSFGMAAEHAQRLGFTINYLARRFIEAVFAVKRFVSGLVDAFQSGGLRGAFAYLKQAAIEGLPIFLEGLSSLISGVWAWMQEQAPSFGQNLGEMIGTGLRMLVDLIIQYGPVVIEAMLKLGGLLLAGLLVAGEWLINTGGPEFIQWAGDLITNFMDGFSAGFGDVNWGEVWGTVWNGAKKGAGLALALLWNTSVWIREKLVNPAIDYLKNDVDWGEVWDKVWNAAKKAAGVALAALWDTSVWIREELVDPAINYLKNDVNWGEVWSTVWNGAKKMAGVALALIWNISVWIREKVYLPILNYFKNQDWSEVGRDLWNGFKNGVNSLWDSLGIEGFFRDLADKGVKAFKDAFGIQSPSTVMWGIGENIAKGLQNGINDNAQGAVNAAMAMAGQINGQVQGAMAQINALNALAARPVGMATAVGGMMTGAGGMSNTISNTNFGGISVIVPHTPTANPAQQGRQVGIGIQQVLRRNQGGTRR